MKTIESKLILKDAFEDELEMIVITKADNDDNYISFELKYDGCELTMTDDFGRCAGSPFFIHRSNLTQLINHLTEIRDGSSQQTKSSGSDILVEEDI